MRTLTEVGITAQNAVRLNSEVLHKNHCISRGAYSEIFYPVFTSDQANAIKRLAALFGPTTSVPLPAPHLSADEAGGPIF